MRGDYMAELDWKTSTSSIFMGSFENTTLKDLYHQKVDSLDFFKDNMAQFFEAVENTLSAVVGHLPHNEIKKRCLKVSKFGDLPFTEKYYLDGKLLFETEVKLSDNKFYWEIRKPQEAQDE